MTGCLSCLPPPRSPPSGQGSLCACVKRFAKGQKSSPCSQALQLEQELPSVLSAIYIGIGCKAPIIPKCCFFPSFLLVCASGALLGFSALLFPGLSLQGVCLVLELASGTITEPSLGDCGALAWGFEHDAWSSCISVSREGRKWEAGQDLTFVEHFTIRFCCFHSDTASVWDEHTFNNEFSFWPLEVLGDNARLPTAFSSRDQSSYVFAHQCLQSAAQKSSWGRSPSALGSCLARQERAVVGGSWGGGICLEPRGDKLLVSL